MKNRGFIDDGTTQSWGEFTKTDLLKKNLQKQEFRKYERRRS